VFKLIGSAIIMIAAILFGTKKYSDLFERKRILCIIRDGVISIQNNLRCTCMPLYECFLQGGEFFEKSALLMRDGILPTEAVLDAAHTLHSLKSADLAAIERFSAGLCCEDCQGQITNTMHFIEELDKNILDAANELNTRGKLVLKGCILSAAAVVILLV